MEPFPNLEVASREELLTLIASLQTAVATLTERVRALEEQSRKGGSPQRMPGTKATEPASKPATPRTPRRLAFVRHRGTPTASVTHAPATCPDCGTALAGGWVQRTREVIDIVLPPATVTEHRLLARSCPVCEQRVVARPDLGTVVAGRQRLGVEVTSLIVTLREELRLPVAAIRRLLTTAFGLSLSAGSIVACCRRVATAGAATVAGWREQVRASPVVHADETGWRENGKNGYIWTLSTPAARTFWHGKRDAATFHQAFRSAYEGVVVSDFYSVYAAEDGTHQWCWAHLLRDIHELVKRFPEDAWLSRWAADVRTIFDAARAMVPPVPWQRGAVLTRLTNQLMAVCTPFLGDDTAPQQTLCRRIEKHLGGLFTFVVTPGVPPDNNAAERSLRHLVTSRKISGGTRSPTGTATKMALATLFGTWRLTNVNSLAACRQLLVSPQH